MAKNNQLRVPPHAADVEGQVLGAMIIDPSSVALVAQLLNEDDFYGAANAKVFTAIKSLFHRGVGVDIITLSHELTAMGCLDEVGGVVRLAELSSSASLANVEHYARILVEKKLMRTIARLESLAHRAYSPGEDAFGLVDEIVQFGIDLNSRRVGGNGFRAASHLVEKTIDWAESLHSVQALTGIDTGFRALNAITGGWQRSNLIVVAGETSVGKTAFAMQCAVNAARAGAAVGIFSLEQSSRQLIARMLCNAAGVDSLSLRTGRMSEEQWRSVIKAGEGVAGLNMWIDDTSKVSVSNIRAKAKLLMSRLSRIDLVVVDYLQLATGEGDTRAEEVGNIAAGLKAMAKEIDSPVIALSQLSRDVEKRPDRVPRLSDLRESGAIEQHADDVLFIHRPEKFDIESYAGYDTKGKAWIIVAKQREGPLDEVRLEYVPRFTRFIEPYSIKNGENV